MKVQITSKLTGLKAVRSLPNTHWAIRLRVLLEILLSSLSVHAFISLIVSPSVWTSVRPSVWTESLSRISAKFFYTVIVFLFFYRTLSLHFVVSKWNNVCPCWQCTILFVWPWSRCVAYSILYYTILYTFNPCGLNFLTCLCFIILLNSWFIRVCVIFTVNSCNEVANRTSKVTTF